MNEKIVRCKLCNKLWPEELTLKAKDGPVCEHCMELIQESKGNDE